jgi:hypothetical protein
VFDSRAAYHPNSGTWPGLKSSNVLRTLVVFVGVLQACDIHDHILYQTFGADVEEEYKYGNANWNEYSGDFKDRREMTDYIKAVSEDSGYANDKCKHCTSVARAD